MEVDGYESQWHEQGTGIRQGCPLSPYLFLVVMTVLFHDVHKDDTINDCLKRVPGANFDEVLYADDTILISTDTRVINKLLAKIEKEGKRYGMKLNRGKCEVVHTGTSANVRFSDREQVQKRWKSSIWDA